MGDAGGELKLNGFGAVVTAVWLMGLLKGLSGGDAVILTAAEGEVGGVAMGPNTKEADGNPPELCGGGGRGSADS